MTNTHTTSTTTTPAPDPWRDVWSDDREANRVSARIQEMRDAETDMADFYAQCRAAVS